MSEIRVDAIKTRAGAVPTANDVGINVAGTILQVQYTQYTDTFTQSYSADTNETIGASALIVNITPKSTSSIIKIDAHVFHEFSAVNTQDNHVWFFYRDSTALKAPAAGSRPCGISMSTINNSTDAGSTPGS